MVCSLTFRCLIHFNLFLYMVCVNVLIFNLLPVFPGPLIEETVFSPCVFFIID